jgi:hypothetical protein
VGRRPLREWSLLFGMWLMLAVVMTMTARRNVSEPGLYYDEALFAGFAKDFVTADPQPHVPAPLVVSVFGRPLPILLQSYLGGLKSWMLIPSFAVFGANLAVLRLTDLCWGLIGLLVFMLWTRKLFGLPTALVAAPILALDPSYFFLSVLDWGPFTPTFLCRVCGWLFFLRWAEKRRWRDGILAALFFGLGVFNKIDFVIILAGTGLALFCTHRTAVLAALSRSRRQIAVCSVVFLLAASPMSFYLSDVFDMAKGTSGRDGDFTEKLNTTIAMYDGSYIYRLIDAGGRFDTMYSRQAPDHSPFGFLVIVSAVLLAVLTVSRGVRAKGLTQEGRLATFLLLCLILITMGALWLPSAVRMHHTTLVYPFPHLVIAFVVVQLWKTPAVNLGGKFGLRVLAVALAGAAITGQLPLLGRTEEYIEETGGRGRWSNSLETFCNEVKDEKGLAIISLDWGFNEQLCFLTEDKQLSEPFWTGHVAVTKAGIYLVHPPAYALFPQGLEILAYAMQHPERGFSIREYRESHHGDVAFYAIRYKPQRN